MSDSRLGFTPSPEPDDAAYQGRPIPVLLDHHATIDYKSELIRKTIHFGSLSIPVIYYFISKEQALTILAPITALFLIIDLARYYHPPTGELFYRWFRWLLRKREMEETRLRLTGATNILISALICVALFPKLITVNAFAILIISDSTAALVGRRYGKRRFFNKSVEGASGFFVSALFVVLLTPKLGGGTTEYLLWSVGAAVGAVAESLSIKVDDNISIPVSIGLTTWGLYALLLPGINLSQLV